MAKVINDHSLEGTWISRAVVSKAVDRVAKEAERVAKEARREDIKAAKSGLEDMSVAEVTSLLDSTIDPASNLEELKVAIKDIFLKMALDILK